MPVKLRQIWRSRIPIVVEIENVVWSGDGLGSLGFSLGWGLMDGDGWRDGKKGNCRLTYELLAL